MDIRLIVTPNESDIIRLTPTVDGDQEILKLLVARKYQNAFALYDDPPYYQSSNKKIESMDITLLAMPQEDK